MCFFTRKIKLLRDYRGDVFKFYRGGSIDGNWEKGKYFSNSILCASMFGIDKKIFECEIQCSYPVVIDATTEFGYTGYEHIDIQKSTVYPQAAKKFLLEFCKREKLKELSTDEILREVIKVKRYDALIIKNVMEGDNNCPVYDVVVWNPQNIVNSREVKENELVNSEIKKWIFSRVNLGFALKSEISDDGVLCCLTNERYQIIKKISEEGKGVETDLLIYTDECISIKISKMTEGEKLIRGGKIEPGVYEYLPLFGNTVFEPNKGIIEIRKINTIMLPFDIICG